MILVAIIALSLVVFTLLAAVFVGLPAFPSSVTQMMSAFTNYLGQGAGVFWAFVIPEIVRAELGFMIAVIGIYEGYKLVMWSVKKLPMFGVSE